MTSSKFLIECPKCHERLSDDMIKIENVKAKDNTFHKQNAIDIIFQCKCGNESFARINQNDLISDEAQAS